MKLATLFVIVLGAQAAGCGNSDDTAFLPFDKLCEAVAEDVCSAPKGCCKVINDPDECVKRVSAECEAQREALAKESSLDYDSEQAEDTRQRQRDLVFDCRAALPIATFFEGGLAKGAACERDSQCETGACDGTCVDGAGPALCNDPGQLPPAGDAGATE